MISKGDYKSICDELAHLSSFNEKTDYCFNILNLNNNQYIVTDFEFHSISLFNSTFNILQYLPFFVLNVLSRYTNNPTLSFDKYFPKWKNKTIIIISKYLENEDGKFLINNHIMLIKHFHPTGFVTRNDNPLLVFLTHIQLMYL